MGQLELFALVGWLGLFGFAWTSHRFQKLAGEWKNIARQWREVSVEADGLIKMKEALAALDEVTNASEA